MIDFPYKLASPFFTLASDDIRDENNPISSYGLKLLSHKIESKLVQLFRICVISTDGRHLTIEIIVKH